MQTHPHQACYGVYISIDFGVDSSSRFTFRAWTQTYRQVTATDATDHPTLRL